MQGRDTRGDVDIVRDQQRLSGFEPDYEPLMPAAFDIIGKDFYDDASSGDLYIACVAGKCFGQSGVARATHIGDRDIALKQTRILVNAEVGGNNDPDQNEKFLHVTLPPSSSSGQSRVTPGTTFIPQYMNYPKN